MASTYIEYAKGGTDYRTKSTISCWVKRSKLGVQQDIWSWGENNSSDAYLRFDTADNLEFQCDGAGGVYNTTQLYRDTNAWYHIVCSLDGSNSTDTLRRRMWVNGVQVQGPYSEGTFSAAVIGWHSTMDFWIGARARSQQTGDIEYFDGLISHFHYCSNYSYAASDFGEYDANGVWKIKTSPNVQYGSEGFFLKMENSSNMDLDSSSNNKTLTTNGTLTKTEDSPSNVFATLNPLASMLAGGTFSNGNNKILTGATETASYTSTLGMTTGKYYAEMKAVTIYNGYAQFGIKGRVSVAGGVGSGTDGYAFYANGGKKVNNDTETAYAGVAWNNNDIIGCAVDLDNNKIYWSRNGTWINSGDPTSGSTGTGSAFNLSTTPLHGAYFFACSDEDNGAGTANTYELNFGNGYFGTTAVSSAGTNASGNGIFEYDVPTGYTALSTKGLNL